MKSSTPIFKILSVVVLAAAVVYFAVQAYAQSRGVRVLNATPGSFIDAFPRTTLDRLGD